MKFEVPGDEPPGDPPRLLDVPGPAGAPRVPIRLFTPRGEPRLRPGILQIHGGGYILGSAEISDAENRVMAAGQDAVIVSVDYRLAPETPFPGPVEDCYAALCWLADNADELGVDPERIVVLGSSAGGGLAAATALVARDRGGPKLAGQYLIYPMIDHRTGGEQHRGANAHVGEFIWTRGLNRFGWDAMRGTEPIDPARIHHFSPALAEDLSGLPPTYIATGALDLFLEEDVDYAMRLAHAGIPTELHVYPGAIHAFDMMSGSEVARCFAADLASALKRGFRP
jgi:triacylglycerol lipase